MLPESMTGHLTDEELLLDFYDESTDIDRTRVRSHLDACEECRALDRELRAVLTAVDTTPITEPPSGFEREMWARLEPLLPVQHARQTRWQWMMPRLAVAASIARAMYHGRMATGKSCSGGWPNRVTGCSINCRLSTKSQHSKKLSASTSLTAPA